MKLQKLQKIALGFQFAYPHKMWGLAITYDAGLSWDGKPYQPSRIQIGGEYVPWIREIVGDLLDDPAWEQQSRRTAVSFHLPAERGHVMEENWNDLCFEKQNASLQDLKTLLRALVDRSGEQVRITFAGLSHAFYPFKWEFSAVSAWMQKAEKRPTLRETFQQLRIFELLDHLESTE